MQPLPIIIPYDRPVSWREYCQGLDEGQALAQRVCRENKVDLDPQIFVEPDQVQTETLLQCAAETLGIPLTGVYRAAYTGRIEWCRPTEYDGSFPIFARLDGGPWKRQPAVKGFDVFSPADHTATLHAVQSAAAQQAA